MGDNVPGAIVGDATRLRQILVNLIGNAIKFTEKGRIDLSVACPERNDQRAVLHFAVTDTGIGINSAALERLFKPFTQADTSMSRRYGGTGLGLAISQRLAHAMGGSLQVQSILNKGTTFRLILPCKLPEVPVATPRLNPAPRPVDLRWRAGHPLGQPDQPVPVGAGGIDAGPAWPALVAGAQQGPPGPCLNCPRR
jgi:hypothetical protein